MVTSIEISALVNIPPLPVFPATYNFDVMARRHATILVNDIAVANADAVEIITPPARGFAHVQQDGNVFINMEDAVGSADASTESMVIRVTEGGSTTDCTVTINVAAAAQRRGWQPNRINTQPVNSDGTWDFLKGADYKEWYVDVDTGMTLQDIADDAGEILSTITGLWLYSRWPDYGGSEATALAQDATMAVQSATPDRNNGAFLLKRGTDCSGLPDELGKTGISSLRPAIVGAYGTGDKPIFARQLHTGRDGGYRHLEDLRFTGTQNFKISSGGPCFTMNRLDMFEIEEVILDYNIFGTVMGCKLLDLRNPGPPDYDAGNSPNWTDSLKGNHTTGLYISSSEGISVVGSLFDRCAYAYEDYRTDGLYIDDTDGGQIPSEYSHNIYCQYTNKDVTIVNCLSFRAASQALQIRNGGNLRGNVCAWTPIGMTANGNGNSDETYIDEDGKVKPVISNEIGQSDYGRHRFNLMTGAWEHTPSLVDLLGSSNVGGRFWGNAANSPGLFMTGDMVVHPNDPNDPNDTAQAIREAIQRNNWPLGEIREGDKNGAGPLWPGSFYSTAKWVHTETGFILPDDDGGIDEAIFNDYTLLRYADSVLSVPNGTSTKEDLINHLRGVDNLLPEAEKIINYMRGGLAAAGDARFAVPAVRTTPTTVIAIPDPAGGTAGIWWDEGLDWSTGDYPGFVDGDSVNMDGHVRYFQITHPVLLADMELGAGGGPIVVGSSLEVTGNLTGAGRIGAEVGGRMIFNGYSGADQIEAISDAGMIINNGTIAGNMNFTITPHQFAVYDDYFMNESRCLICTGGESVTIGAGDKLEIHGHTDVVLDGASGVATLNFDAASELKFVASGTSSTRNPYEFGLIHNDQTGHFPDTPIGITSVVNLNGTPVTVDATGMAAGTYTVMDVDTLNGSLGTLNVIGGNASIAVVGNTLEITVTV